MDEEIDGMVADFVMRLTREVKQLSESVRKVNDWQTCFESVLKLGPGPTEDERIDLMPRTTQ